MKIWKVIFVFHFVVIFVPKNSNFQNFQNLNFEFFWILLFLWMDCLKNSVIVHFGCENLNGYLYFSFFGDLHTEISNFEFYMYIHVRIMYMYMYMSASCTCIGNMLYYDAMLFPRCNEAVCCKNQNTVPVRIFKINRTCTLHNMRSTCTCIEPYMVTRTCSVYVFSTYLLF